VSFEVRSREISRDHRPERRGQVVDAERHQRRLFSAAGQYSIQGRVRRRMNPHRAAAQGIARTFQNIALFKGMTVLDNIMTGRYLKMRSTLLEQALYIGRNRARSSHIAPRSRRSSTSCRSSTSARRRSAGCPTACKSAWSWRVRSPPSPCCCCSTSRWRA
jgi:ABC-type branched-subunit amino acid transport system ATPase component